MSNSKNDSTELAQPKRGSLPMLKLTLPMIGEQFLRILISSADTFMLSSYSSAAVAGVGLVAQWCFFLMILFNVVVIGANIVLAQYLGAEKSNRELNDVAKAGFIMVMIISAVFVVIVFCSARFLLSLYTLDAEVSESAFKYFLIYGGIGAPFTAFSLFQTGILRTYGYTRETLIVSIISNLVNVAGNALALYGLFGLPVTGTAGVAAASVAGNFVGIIIMFVMIKRRKDIQCKIFSSPNPPKRVYRLILSIGIPTGGESLAYNTAQITVMALISSLGTNAMSTQVFTNTIIRFTYITGMGIGNAVQIKTGYYVGAGQKDVAYRKVYKYSIISSAITTGLVLLLNVPFIKNPIVGLFTKDPVVFEMTTNLMLYSIYLEFGRSLNLIYVGALKGSGDVKFPVVYGIFSMWGIQVLLSFILIKCGFGIVGAWLGIATDEFTRGVVMLFRWKSKRWQKKSIV